MVHISVSSCLPVLFHTFVAVFFCTVRMLSTNETIWPESKEPKFLERSATHWHAITKQGEITGSFRFGSSSVMTPVTVEQKQLLCRAAIFPRCNNEPIIKILDLAYCEK